MDQVFQLLCRVLSVTVQTYAFRHLECKVGTTPMRFLLVHCSENRTVAVEVGISVVPTEQYMGMRASELLRHSINTCKQAAL